MLEKIIINSICESPDAVVVFANNGKKFQIFKKDLKNVTLFEGDSVSVFIHPNYPEIVAGLKIGQQSVFQKSREAVIDLYLKKIEAEMIENLSKVAKNRLKMFEVSVPEFKYARRMTEATALKLGQDLYAVYAEDISSLDEFINLSDAHQRMVFPQLDNLLLPSVSIEALVEVAKAYAADIKNGVLRNLHLANSAIMHLPLADAERYGDLCQPRDEYIEKYIHLI